MNFLVLVVKFKIGKICELFVFIVIMEENLLILALTNSLMKMALNIILPFLEPLHKMELWKGKIELYKIWPELCLMNSISLKLFGLKPLTPLAMFLIVSTSTQLLRKLLTSFGMIKSPKIDYFRVFGCKCFILNTLRDLDHFDSKCDEGIFIGYSERSKAYRVYNKATLRVEETLHVKFIENRSNSPSNSNDYLDLSKLTFDKEDEGPKQDDPLAKVTNQRRSIHP